MTTIQPIYSLLYTQYYTDNNTHTQKTQLVNSIKQQVLNNTLQYNTSIYDILYFDRNSIDNNKTSKTSKLTKSEQNNDTEVNNDLKIESINTLISNVQKYIDNVNKQLATANKKKDKDIQSNNKNNKTKDKDNTIDKTQTIEPVQQRYLYVLLDNNIVQNINDFNTLVKNNITPLNIIYFNDIVNQYDVNDSNNNTIQQIHSLSQLLYTQPNTQINIQQLIQQHNADSLIKQIYSTLTTEKHKVCSILLLQLNSNNIPLSTTAEQSSNSSTTTTTLPPVNGSTNSVKNNKKKDDTTQNNTANSAISSPYTDYINSVISQLLLLQRDYIDIQKTYNEWYNNVLQQSNNNIIDLPINKEQLIDINNNEQYTTLYNIYKQILTNVLYTPQHKVNELISQVIVQRNEHNKSDEISIDTLLVEQSNSDHTQVLDNFDILKNELLNNKNTNNNVDNTIQDVTNIQTATTEKQYKIYYSNNTYALYSYKQHNSIHDTYKFNDLTQHNTALYNRLYNISDVNQEQLNHILLAFNASLLLDNNSGNNQLNNNNSNIVPQRLHNNTNINSSNNVTDKYKLYNRNIRHIINRDTLYNIMNTVKQYSHVVDIKQQYIDTVDSNIIVLSYNIPSNRIKQIQYECYLQPNMSLQQYIDSNQSIQNTITQNIYNYIDNNIHTGQIAIQYNVLYPAIQDIYSNQYTITNTTIQLSDNVYSSIELYNNLYSENNEFHLYLSLYDSIEPYNVPDTPVQAAVVDQLTTTVDMLSDTLNNTIQLDDNNKKNKKVNSKNKVENNNTITKPTTASSSTRVKTPATNTQQRGKTPNKLHKDNVTVTVDKPVTPAIAPITIPVQPQPIINTNYAITCIYDNNDKLVLSGSEQQQMIEYTYLHPVYKQQYINKLDTNGNIHSYSKNIIYSKIHKLMKQNINIQQPTTYEHNTDSTTVVSIDEINTLIYNNQQATELYIIYYSTGFIHIYNTLYNITIIDIHSGTVTQQLNKQYILHTNKQGQQCITDINNNNSVINIELNELHVVTGTDVLLNAYTIQRSDNYVHVKYNNNNEFTQYTNNIRVYKNYTDSSNNSYELHIESLLYSTVIYKYNNNQLTNVSCIISPINQSIISYNIEKQLFITYYNNKQHYLITNQYNQTLYIQNENLYNTVYNKLINNNNYTIWHENDMIANVYLINRHNTIHSKNSIYVADIYNNIYTSGCNNNNNVQLNTNNYHQIIEPVSRIFVYDKLHTYELIDNKTAEYNMQQYNNNKQQYTLMPQSQRTDSLTSSSYSTIYVSQHYNCTTMYNTKPILPTCLKPYNNILLVGNNNIVSDKYKYYITHYQQNNNNIIDIEQYNNVIKTYNQIKDNIDDNDSISNVDSINDVQQKQQISEQQLKNESELKQIIALYEQQKQHKLDAKKQADIEAEQARQQKINDSRPTRFYRRNKQKSNINDHEQPIKQKRTVQQLYDIIQQRNANYNNNNNNNIQSYFNNIVSNSNYICEQLNNDIINNCTYNEQVSIVDELNNIIYNVQQILTKPYNTSLRTITTNNDYSSMSLLALGFKPVDDSSNNNTYISNITQHELIVVLHNVTQNIEVLANKCIELQQQQSINNSNSNSGLQHSDSNSISNDNNHSVHNNDSHSVSSIEQLDIVDEQQQQQYTPSDYDIIDKYNSMDIEEKTDDFVVYESAQQYQTNNSTSNSGSVRSNNSNKQSQKVSSKPINKLNKTATFSVTPTSVDFGKLHTGQTVRVLLNVRNNGHTTGRFNVQQIQNNIDLNSTQLGLNYQPGTLSAGLSKKVEVILTAGQYNELYGYSLVIASENNTVHVPIKAQIVGVEQQQQSNDEVMYDNVEYNQQEQEQEERLDTVEQLPTSLQYNQQQANTNTSAQPQQSPSNSYVSSQPQFYPRPPATSASSVSNSSVKSKISVSSLRQAMNAKS